MNNATTLTISLQYGNANSTSEQFIFSVTGTNCPTNTALTLQDNGAAHVNLTAYLPAPNSQGQQVAVTSSVPIPAAYTGTLVVTATAPQGQTFGSNATLSVTAYQLASSTASDRQQRVPETRRPTAC